MSIAERFAAHGLLLSPCGRGGPATLPEGCRLGCGGAFAAARLACFYRLAGEGCRPTRREGCRLCRGGADARLGCILSPCRRGLPAYPPEGCRSCPSGGAFAAQWAWSCSIALRAKSTGLPAGRLPLMPRRALTFCCRQKSKQKRGLVGYRGSFPRFPPKNPPLPPFY